MAVIRRGGFPRRQQDPLIQQLLEQARREAAQSSAIGSPSMYKAAAGGGIGPVAGVLTAQVLGGIRAGNALQAAQLKQEQANTKHMPCATVFKNKCNANGITTECPHCGHFFAVGILK